VHQKLEHFSKNFNKKTKIETKVFEIKNLVYDELDEEEEEKEDLRKKKATSEK
jgi:hypothetical protein